jgi:hypothetical protein
MEPAMIQKAVVRFLFAAGLFLLSDQMAEAQTLRCPPCEIRLTAIAELSSRAAAFTPSIVNTVTRFSDGSFAVAPQFVEPLILLYDAVGLVRVEFDRRGSGPGELESPPVLFMGRGDTLLALEGVRGTLFDAGLRPIRTQRLPSRAPSILAVLSDGRMVANWRVSLPDGRVSQAALLDATWGLLKPLEPASPETAVRGLQMAASSRGGAWLLHPGSSEVKHLSNEGELVTAVSIRRRWFEPWVGQPRAPGEGVYSRPRPSNAGLSELSPESLLVITSVASPAWKPAASPGEPLRPAETSILGNMDTMLEVVDSSTGEVLAASKVPGVLRGVSGAPDCVFATRQENDGHVTILLWKVELIAR